MNDELGQKKFENRFSVDIIGGDDICVNLQLIEISIVEGVLLRHISSKCTFSCPIGHHPPNLLCSGYETRNQVKIRKRVEFYPKTILIMILVIHIELHALELKGVPYRYSWKQKYSTPLTFSH